MSAYYNEFDPFAAQWLRNLISAGCIAPGDVDERSIEDVRPDDLRPYKQCHFFAGIGGWSHALRLAGWSDDRPVWTGSCPCQPFSSAGRQKGKADDRHLWPVWFRLIQECRPATIFGEQVASAIAHGWLDDVYQGLEQEGYAVGSAVLPACSVGAPHKRDRLWFVADNTSTGLPDGGGAPLVQPRSQPQPERCSGHVAYAESERSGGAIRSGSETLGRSTPGNSLQFGGAGGSGGNVGQPLSERLQGHAGDGQDGNQPGWVASIKERSAWSTGVWINCPDGKQRLVEPSIPLLAHGVSNRVGKLRGYGNAIVPQAAQAFIESYMEI